jgi:hypothetical protein
MSVKDVKIVARLLATEDTFRAAFMADPSGVAAARGFALSAKELRGLAGLRIEDLHFSFSVKEEADTIVIRGGGGSGDTWSGA